MKQYKKLPDPVKEILGLLPSHTSSSDSSPATREPSPFPSSTMTNSSASVKVVSSPDDGSIEILSDAADSAVNNYYH